MTARSEERARLRNALEVCRREAERVEDWNASADVWYRSTWHGREVHVALCRAGAAACAIHAERAARAYFKGR